MAKAGLLYIGSDDGVFIFSNPGGAGRWLAAAHELRGYGIRDLLPVARNPLCVTVATVLEGLQRTEDGGQTWRKVLDIDAFAIAAHPAAPETIYIGAEGGEIYRSYNNGKIWEQCPCGAHPVDVEVTALLVAPEAPDKLYLALEGGGLWSSPDRGVTWEPRARGLPPRVTALAASPTIPGRLFAAAEGVFYRSDSGTSWEQIRLPQAEEPSERSALTLLPGDEEVLLTTSGNGILRSTDQGSSWHPTSSQVAWTGTVSVISPVSYHMDTAYAGSVRGQVAVTTDRGRTWQPVADGLPAIRCIEAVRLA